ncbi:MAG: O-antigen ligase family protein [Verrucomicrobia bacterium]|nr:O-antigen ligase family protein [Verrucomicrobiota bacterium]
MNGPASPTRSSSPEALRFFALIFGAFLGLCILKWGNPVILDAQIPMPRDAAEWLQQPWPSRLAPPFLMVLVVVGVMTSKPMESLRGRHIPALLLILPAIWMSWQSLAAGRSVDPVLTGLTLPQLAGCLACYSLGFLVLGPALRSGWLWVGLIAGFGLCLNRAAQQHLFELRQDYQVLLEGQATGWTNFTASSLAEMRDNLLLIQTNGVEIANPVILDKMRRARVNGTMVYPNALAGMILLLLPASLAVLATVSATLKTSVRRLVVGSFAVLGLLTLYWTGSKAGWLVAIGVGAVALLLRPGSARIKAAWVALLLAGGLGLFGLRFAGYFAKGATSAVARTDYWKAAVQNTWEHPLWGSGPGTFQRPYARLKAPESEMARLVHNDFLEQASDSGLPGFALYTAWIGGLLWTLGRRITREKDLGAQPLEPSPAGAAQPSVAGWPVWPEVDRQRLELAVFIGLLGWFTHGLAEFGLYIPASAWTAFTLAGALLAGVMPRR